MKDILPNLKCILKKTTHRDSDKDREEILYHLRKICVSQIHEGNLPFYVQPNQCLVLLQFIMLFMEQM